MSSDDVRRVILLLHACCHCLSLSLLWCKVFLTLHTVFFLPSFHSFILCSLRDLGNEAPCYCRSPPPPPTVHSSPRYPTSPVMPLNWAKGRVSQLNGAGNVRFGRPRMVQSRSLVPYVITRSKLFTTHTRIRYFLSSKNRRLMVPSDTHSLAIVSSPSKMK